MTTNPVSDQKEKAKTEEVNSEGVQDKAGGMFNPKMFPKLAQLTDRFGNTFFFGNAGDYWHIPFPIGADNDYRTHARNIRDLEIRPDDVLICSFPKTGLHWHVEIIHMLKANKVEFTSRTNGNMVDSFLDAKATTGFESLPSPRTLVTHVPFRYIPRQAFEKKVKIVYLDRNPKDILVSFYNQISNHKGHFNYPGTFEHFFHLSLEVGYLCGDLFDYLLEWQRGIEAHPDCPIYTSVFEDMKLDPVAGVKRLNEFLATGCSDELCEQIAVACSFANMKEYKDSIESAQREAMFKNKNSFYRKGEVGDWKNWFTVAMNEEFDAEYKKRMAEYKTVYKFTLDH